MKEINFVDEATPSFKVSHSMLIKNRV